MKIEKRSPGSSFVVVFALLLALVAGLSPVNAKVRNIARSASMLGLQANFVDSLPYHNLQGQLHCGTNVFRHPNKYFVKPR